jgi:Protein of unknown function (DUF4232)
VCLVKLALPITVALALIAGLARAGGTAAVPRCHTPDLRGYTARIGGAAGTLAGDLAFRNRSGHTCFVFGYPGLGLENTAHRALPSRVTWGSTPARRDRRPHRVVLVPGRAAFANLSWSDVPVRSERCVQPTWLAVTPPDEFTHRLVPFKAPVCSHGHLTVTALSRTRTPHG